MLNNKPLINFIEELVLNEKETENVEEEIDLLLKGQKGKADIFSKYNKENIKIIDTKVGNGYIFNEVNCLWELKDQSYFVNYITEWMELFIYRKLVENKNKINDKILKELKLIVKELQNYSKVESIFKFAKSNLYDKIFESKLNSISHLLPIKNKKVINLKTLKIENRRMDYYFDFEIDCDFIEGEEKNINEMSNIEKQEFIRDKLKHAYKFFNQIMGYKEEVVKFLQYHLGYCLTRETKLRSVYIFWGNGRNGKSVLCNLLEKIMNKLFTAASKEVFIKEKKSSGHTEHLMPLMNARLAVYSESDKKETLNESLLKSLTGGDSISIRAIYGKQFSFRPPAKYIMLTNHKPKFDTISQSILDRIIYIPFSARFSYNPIKCEIQADDKFIEKLTNEYLDEVFTFLCIGAHYYYKDIEKGKTIETPELINAAKNEYIKEIDTVSAFINEYCITIKESIINDLIENKKHIPNEYKTDRVRLHGSYCEWAKDNCDECIKNTEFYKTIEKLGYTIKSSNGKRYILGLVVNHNLDEEDEEHDVNDMNTV